MTAYRLNLRVFWPLVTCGCTALLGLWPALRIKAGAAWDGAPAALLRGALLALVLLACLALRCRPPRRRSPPSPQQESPVGEPRAGQEPRRRRRALLEDFYERQLRLSPHVLGHSKAHVSLVVGELVRAGKAAGRLALRGDFVQVGSAYEQHKVRSPDAFDVLVPLRLPPGLAVRVEPRSAGRRGAFVCALQVAAPGGLSEALCVEEEGGGRHLSAALLLRWFQGHVQRCLGPVRSRLQERVRVTLAVGPGRPLALHVVPRSDYVCCHLSLTVRLVPAVPFGETLFLTARPTSPGKLPAFWTLDVSKLEQRLLAWLKEQSPADSCHLRGLQILKGLRDLGGRDLEQPLASQWGRVLSSYVLKTAIFVLLLRGPLEAWADQFLVERLEDLILFLAQSLRRRLLRHVFLGNPALPEAVSLPKFVKEAAPVNLLADFEGPTLDKVAAHLLNTWQHAPQIISMYSGHRYRRTHPV
ncbi:inositol 1,4,5-trisphosphate receptor-interacting protein-like 2 [Heteronotia binoei]|uniref:inositol 1,4,5-trisphosphate receptor-interacting protein-like 2 n=1 Tax=Heteronotia binoei TaxID=13085 RepID=UPI00292D3B00|nr:inositol 1,4,5-trisphosphate receptor-interacting protein-like 2 [Heteronotia binoei]